MQPARKLLSLLFLILMGTELTQVRASNAIFLSARERRPPGPGGTRQSRGAAQRSGRRAPRLGRTPECRPHLGWREGCRLTETGAAELPRTPSPGPARLRRGAPLPAEKFGDQREGSFGCYCFWGEAEQRVQAPGVFRGGSALTPRRHPASHFSGAPLPLAVRLPLGLLKLRNVGTCASRTRLGRAGGMLGWRAWWARCGGLRGGGRPHAPVKC